MPDHPTRTLCVKPSAIIASSGYLCRTARHIYNLILAETLSDLKDQADFTFPLTFFTRSLSRNTDFLKEALAQLKRKEINYDLLGKDGRGEWLCSSLLGEARIKNGMVHVHFLPGMRELLSDPQMYAKINLLVSSKLSSKHALILYELALDWLGDNRLYATSGIVEIATLREIFNCEEKYARTKDFVFFVLKKAQKEVNDPKNNTGLHVTYKAYKHGRKTVGFIFSVQKKATDDTNTIEVKTKPTVSGLADAQNKLQKKDELIKINSANEYYKSLSTNEKDLAWAEYHDANQLTLISKNDYWLDTHTLDRKHPDLQRGFLLHLYQNMVLPPVPAPEE